MRISQAITANFIHALIVSLFLMLVSCSSFQHKQGKPSPDWSRGLRLGQSVIGSTGIWPDTSAEQMHFVWPVESQDGESLHYLRLDETAKPILERNIPFDGQVRAPRILPAGNGLYHLIWASRKSGETDWSLFHNLLDQNGEFVNASNQLISIDLPVGEYVTASDLENGVVILLEDAKRGGITLAHLTRDGSLTTGPFQVTQEGESPALWVEKGLEIHLAWKEGDGIWYTNFSGIPPTAGINPVRMAEIKIGRSGDLFVGPTLGVARTWVYIFWSVLSTTDTQSGSAKTNYIAFRTGEPDSIIPNQLWTLALEDQPYSLYQGIFPLSNIVLSPDFLEANLEYGIESPRMSEAHGDWVTLISGTSDYIMKPVPMMGAFDELAIALTVSQDYRSDSYLQIATALFSDGVYEGYSMATRTNNISDDPVLAVDRWGNLHLVWREGALGRDVYYATTSPISRANLDRLSIGDVSNFFLQGSMDVITSLAFLPFVGFGWMLPGFLVLGARKLFRDRDNLGQRTTWILLGISIMIYQISKFTTLPTVVTYVPFSAWISIPGNVSTILRVSLPVLIFGFSLAAANLIRTRYSDSAILFYIAYALIDASLTLAIYGVNFMGAL